MRKHMLKFFLALLATIGISTKGPVNALNTAPTGPVPNGAIGQAYNWTLDFQEEFSGTAIDYTNKWSPCIYWGIAPDGCWENTSNLEWYKTQNITVANDIARIQGQKVTPFTTSKGTFSYTSGFLTTDRNSGNLNDTVNKIKYDFQYGYAEIRAKVPAGKGIWPAFWLLPTNHENGEIDIMEILGDHPETSYMTYHWDSKSGSGLQIGKSWNITGTDFSQDYHTYAVDWDQTSITWYIDGTERQKLAYVAANKSYTALYQNGVEVQRITGSNILPQKRLALIANLQIGGSWAGAPDATTPFPANYDIDYIRVWKKGAVAPTPTPSPTPTPAPLTNQLQNSSFAADLSAWSLDVKTGATATLARDASGFANINITQSSTTNWYVQFLQSGLTLTQGKVHTISFMAKASTSRTVAVVVQKMDTPYTEYTNQNVTLTTTWAPYTITFTSPATESNAKLSFSLAKNTGTVSFDQLSFSK